MITHGKISFTIRSNIVVKQISASLKYSIIHRFFPCRHWLYNCKVVDTPYCEYEYCNIDDTLVHHFIECVNLSTFWCTFNLWWNRISAESVIISQVMVLFGMIHDINSKLNYCILLVKKKLGKNTFDLFDFCYVKTSSLDMNFTTDYFVKEWSLLFSPFCILYSKVIYMRKTNSI